ncbi:MAG: hypothetical protein AB8D78_13835 [Akkermansiaceae bacterium]
MKKLSLLIILSQTMAFSAEEIDIDARRESVVVLKQHVEMREQRLEEVTSRLKASVQGVDQKIGKVVEILSNTKDSQQSKMQISQLKSETIGGLKGMIQTYDRKRRDVLERLRTEGDTGSNTRTEELAALDKAINKRADEIMTLAKSIPPGEDVEKYEKSGSYYVDGYSYENSRVTDEWRQNRRDQISSTKQRRELQEALKGAIEDLENRRNGVSTALNEKKLTDAQRQLRESELKRIEGLISSRKQQLLSLTTDASSPRSSANRNQAADLKMLLKDAKSDIGRDFSMTLQLFDQVISERESVAASKDNLAARIKWLEDYDAKQKN